MRPPLELLQTFEIAARHGSFAEAARQLNLTPSAVSHQIRKLEERLGVSLFDRNGPVVRPSAAGTSLLSRLQPTLRSIDQAVAALTGGDATSGSLAIACSSMFANRVLSHRLPAYMAAYPLIACQISSVQNDAVLDERGFDVAILFGRGPWPSYWTMSLGPMSYAPVCSPSLDIAPQDVREPRDLLRHANIHLDDGQEWSRWYRAAGVAQAAPARQMFCNDAGFAMEVAASGGGVVLASDMMVESYLKSGLLIRPFRLATPFEGTWHIVVPAERAAIPRIHLFVSWLTEHLGGSSPSVE